MQISSVETAFLYSPLPLSRSTLLRTTLLYAQSTSLVVPSGYCTFYYQQWTRAVLFLVVNRSDLWAHSSFIHFFLCHKVGTVRTIVEFALWCENRNSFCVKFLNINGQHLASPLILNNAISSFVKQICDCK